MLTRRWSSLFILAVFFAAACGESPQSTGSGNSGARPPTFSAGPTLPANATVVTHTTVKPTDAGEGFPTEPGATSTVLRIPTSAPTTEPGTAPTTVPDNGGKPHATVEPPAVEGRAENAAKQLLVRELKLKPADISVVSSRETDWSDTSLGCPEPGMGYAEVLTPGYVVVLGARGKRYTVHTDLTSRAVRCEKGATGGIAPAPTKGTGGGVTDVEAAQAVNAAKQTLVKEQGVSIEEIKLISVEEREWSDGSLGCPKPGMYYPQIITPGHLVVLEAGGEKHNVHTDKRGRAVVCDRKPGS